VHREGKVGSTRHELDAWMATLPQPRTIAMEATIFTGWIYDHLQPHASAVKVAHPLMLRAIALAKKKNDKIDASKIADCLRCDFLPECHMASTEIRDRRRILRYRHLIMRQMVQTKKGVSGLLLETGVEHTKSRLHKVGYFRRLTTTNSEIDDSIRPLLRISRETIERCQKTGPRLLLLLHRPLWFGKNVAARDLQPLRPACFLAVCRQCGMSPCAGLTALKTISPPIEAGKSGPTEHNRVH